MTDPSRLSFDEGLWLALLLLQILCLYCWCWIMPEKRSAWFQPPVIVSVVFMYYTVVGPLYGITQGLWVERGVDVRDGYLIAWQGATISFASFLVGYGLLRQRMPKPKLFTSLNPMQAWRFGRTLNQIGILLYALVQGQNLLVMLNPFTARQAEQVSTGFDFGAFSAYASSSINLLIPGILLMMAAWVRNRRNTIELVLWLLVAGGIYTTIAFRYRLALLFSGMLILWYLGRGKTPKLLTVFSVITSLMFMSGLLVQGRQYGRGINFDAIRGMNFLDLVLAGFQEASVFNNSAGVMRLIPDHIPYVGLSAIWEVVIMPIPRAFWPDKPKAEYISDATEALFGSINNSGSAILNYTEYFLIGDWPVLILGYILLGFLSRRLWLWFVCRRDEPVAQVSYVTAVVYLYMVISRGYLAQVVTLFCFTVLPIFVYYYLVAKPASSFSDC